MTPCELTASITAFANAFASRLSNDEIALWGSVFTQLGDTLETISAHKELLQNLCKDHSENKN